MTLNINSSETTYLSDIMASYIGIEVINGVHYFNVLASENDKNNQVLKLQNAFAKIGQSNLHLIDTIPIKGGKIVIINEELCEQIAKRQIHDISNKYEGFKQLGNYVNLKESKKREAKLLAEEIAYRKEDFDVYLYKMKGARKKTMFANINGQDYHKIITGYRLTVNDIKQVNLFAAEHGYKVVGIQPCEMLDRELGVRFTLKIGKADIIE